MLSQSPGDAKALWRRSEAREALGQLDSAFEDMRKLCLMDPSDKSARCE